MGQESRGFRLSNSTAQPTSHLRFSRAQRLSHAPDIESVRRTGKRVKSGLLDVRVTASPSSCARVGIVVPKYGHIIVERNRLRRRIREIVRVHMLPVLASVPPTDVLIRALPRAYSASFDVLEREIDGIVARIT
jgi:ribonuclease P protein component